MENTHENLWGYLKRLRFVQDVIAESFPHRAANSLRVLDVGCGNGSEGVASFLAGPFIGHTLARSDRFVEWNARVTDKLPRVLASGWYFALRRETKNP